MGASLITKMNRLSNVVSIASTRLIGVEAFILAKKRSHIKISAHLGETSEIVFTQRIF